MIGDFIGIQENFGPKKVYRIAKLHLATHSKNIGYILDFYESDYPESGETENDPKLNCIWLSQTFLMDLKEFGEHTEPSYSYRPEMYYDYMTESEFLLEKVQ
jgi:hypothetical protein